MIPFNNSEKFSLSILNTTTETLINLNIPSYGKVGVINDKLFIAKPYYYANVVSVWSYKPYLQDTVYNYIPQEVITLDGDGSIYQYSIQSKELIKNGFIYDTGGSVVLNNYEYGDGETESKEKWILSPIPSFRISFNSFI